MRVIAFLCLIVMSTPAFAGVVSDPMRGFIWGLSQNEIADFERGRFVESKQGSLFYTARVYVAVDQYYKALIEYGFNEGKLNKIRYDFGVSDSRPNDNIEDMMRVQRWIDAGADQPSQPDFYFRYDYDRTHPNKWGWAVYRGDAQIHTDWTLEDYRARLSFTGGDFVPDLRLVLYPPTP